MVTSNVLLTTDQADLVLKFWTQSINQAVHLSTSLHLDPPGPPLLLLLLHHQTVTNLLSEYPYVIVISLDFSKAFDTVRHTTVLQKLAQLDIPDAVYNWLVDYFASHSHCTKYGGSTSSLCQISASIVQGSAIDPVSYVVSASDLRAVTPGNELCSMLMILTSSFQLPTSTLDAPSSTTYNTGQRRIT